MNKKILNSKNSKTKRDLHKDWFMEFDRYERYNFQKQFLALNDSPDSGWLNVYLRRISGWFGERGKITMKRSFLEAIIYQSANALRIKLKMRGFCAPAKTRWMKQLNQNQDNRPNVEVAPVSWFAMLPWEMFWHCKQGKNVDHCESEEAHVKHM